MEGEDWGEPESRIISVRSSLPYLKRVHTTNDRWLALVLNGLSCLLSFPPLFRTCDEFFALNESVEGTGEKTEEEEEEKVKGSPSPLPLL